MGPTRVTAAVPTPSHPLQFVQRSHKLRDAMPTKFLLIVLAALALCSSLGCSHKGPHSVTIRWQPPEGVSVSGYNVYRSTSADGQFTKIATGVGGPPYEDNLVTSGRTYFYAVTAVDRAGHESRFSTETRAIIP